MWHVLAKWIFISFNKLKWRFPCKLKMGFKKWTCTALAIKLQKRKAWESRTYSQNTLVITIVLCREAWVSMHTRQLDSSHWKERSVIQHGTSWHAPSCLNGQHPRSGWEGLNLLHKWSHWYYFSLPSPMWLYISHLLHFIHVSEIMNLLL